MCAVCIRDYAVCVLCVSGTMQYVCCVCHGLCSMCAVCVRECAVCVQYVSVTMQYVCCMCQGLCSICVVCVSDYAACVVLFYYMCIVSMRLIFGSDFCQGIMLSDEV